MIGIRNPNIDLIKTVAMLLVILIHTSTMTHHGFLVCSRGSVAAVPLFFMVAGWLLIPKPTLDWAYVWRKVKAILRVMLIGFIILYLGISLLEGWAVPPRQVPEHMALQFLLSFLQMENYTTLWFFGALILMYLLTPWLGSLYRERPRAFAWVFAAAAALLLAAFVLNNTPVQYLHGLKWPFEENVPQTLRVWNWLFYFTLGGFLRRPGVVAALKPHCTLMALAALLILNEWLQVKLDLNYYGNYLVEYNYSSPVTVLLAVVLFVWLLKVPLPRPCKPLQELAPLFIPVYLFQMKVIYYLRESIDNLPLVWLIASVVMISGSWLIMRIPLVRKAFTI